jgi:hypothetical protein
MQLEGLKAALRAPKLVLRFRAMVRSCIVALQAGVCMVLTNEDMPLVFARIVSAVVRGGSTASFSADDGGSPIFAQPAARGQWGLLGGGWANH